MVVSSYKSETTGSNLATATGRDVDERTIRAKDDGAKYPEFLPFWNRDENYPQYEEITVDDRGSRVTDTTYPNLLPRDKLASGAIKVKHITPRLGTEIIGIQLSSLSTAAKDELAHLGATRGVIIFRSQDFATLGPSKVKDWHRHFGPLHIHPTSGQVEGHPELHLVYRRPHDQSMAKYFEQNLNSNSYHSDNSYELNPLSYTLLTMLESPPVGGDTIFVDMEEAYNRLSPRFKKMLEGIEAIHSSVQQVEASRRNRGVIRREAVETTHPIVRTHPVTGNKALFVNPQFTRRIVGLKQEESDAILKLLFDHLAQSVDFSLRAQWEEGTVAFWDNRKLVHSAVSDWDVVGEYRRHAFRLGARGERPF